MIMKRMMKRLSEEGRGGEDFPRFRVGEFLSDNLKFLILRITLVVTSKRNLLPSKRWELKHLPRGHDLK